MNTTSHAILQSVLSSDKDLSGPENETLRRLLSGEPEAAPNSAPTMLLTQKEAAQQLSLSRVTLWRLTKQGLFHPVEVTPSTRRYHYSEIAAFARTGCQRQPVRSRRNRPAQAAA